MNRLSGVARANLAAACAATAVTLAGCGTPAGGSPRAHEPVPVDPAAIGWKVPALQRAVDYARGQKTTGFLVIHDRRIVAEYNWPLAADAGNFRAAFVHGLAPSGALWEDVASQQKSFIAILVGVAVDQGLIDIGRPVSSYTGTGWSKAEPAAEARITVRHLLEMTSGLKEDLTPEAEPGARFFYNTPAYAILKKVLEGAARRPLDELTRRWLTEPVGMAETGWRLRPAALGDVGNPTGLVTTPRDIARMGQLVLDGGRALDGRQVISQAQLQALLRRTPTNPAYGQLWWLNGGSHVFSFGQPPPRREGALVPAAPADMVVALGAQDRQLFVVPSRQLLVVRTGQATPDRDFSQKLWSQLMQALP